MSGLREVPRQARRFIYAVLLLGVGAVAYRVPDIRNWSGTDLLALLCLTAAVVVGEQFILHLRHRTESMNFSVTDATFAAALFLARPSVITMAVGSGVLIGHSMRGWKSYKIAFNVGNFLVGITAAELVFRALPDGSVTNAEAWFSVAVAMAAFFVINAGTVAKVVSLVEGKSFRSVILPALPLDVVHWAGNLAIGVLGALVWKKEPLAIPLLLVPLVLSYFAYRAWLQGMRERDRMRSLYEAGHALYAPLTEEEYRPFIRLVQQMLDAQAAELVVVNDEQVTVHDSEGTFSLTPAPGEDGSRRPPEAYVRVRPGLSSHLAVIGGGGEVRGVLVAYRDTAFSSSERSLLDALASQVFVRLENLRLFSEIVEQRTQLADIITHTSDGIFVVSPDREVLSWNPAMEKITGVPASRAVGSTVDEVLGFSEAEMASLVAGSASEKGGGSVRDILLIRADGTQRWVRYARNPIQDKDGALKGYVLVARDVTADVEAEQLKADFVATVSHELRTPLTPLKGFLSSLLEGTVEDSPQAREEYYRIMLNQASRLERLITDLLEVSRLESGKPVVDMAPVELTPIVAASVRDFQSADARLVLRAPKDPVFVRADPFRMGQVISNLLSNALKYSPPNEAVEVTVSREAEQAIVSVEDHGEGIPESEQQRVFERFHRVDSGSTRRTGGTGLGLYIAKRLVEAMAGRLWLTSRPGEGSTFSFSLPLAETGSLFSQLAEPVTDTGQPESELRLP